MTMTFEQALAQPGPLLAAWNLNTWKGKRTLSVFSLVEDKAVRLGSVRPEPDAEEQALEPIRARGIPLGEYDNNCDFVWLVVPERVTVWGPRWRVLDAAEGSVTLADGERVSRADIASVAAFSDPDRIGRGVRARLRSGGEIALVEDVSAAAFTDPTYSRNELLADSLWAGRLAQALAAWAGVPYENLV